METGLCQFQKCLLEKLSPDKKIQQRDSSNWKTVHWFLNSQELHIVSETYFALYYASEWLGYPTK